MVLEEAKYPHLAAVRNVFIRGSVVRYVHLPAGAVDTALLEDATRRGMFSSLLVVVGRRWRVADWGCLEASNAAAAKGR